MSIVDPQAQRLLDAWADEAPIPLSELTPHAVRTSDRAVELLQREPESVEHSEDYRAATPVGTISLRVYTPLDSVAPLPILIYFHGGGFVVGSESYQSPLRALTNRSKCLVCAVDYRLAPEAPFPAAIEDAFAACMWVFQNAHQLGGHVSRVAIGGDSSGGNLAAVVTLLNRDRKAFALQHQVLIYPMLDATCSQPSTREFATGYGFTTAKMNWYFDQYLPSGIDKRQQTISPLFAETVADLPPAYIATAECDPLRDEAEAYGARLQEAGVAVTLKRYRGMIHGFLQMSGALDQSQVLIDDVGSHLRQALAPSEPR